MDITPGSRAALAALLLLLSLMHFANNVTSDCVFGMNQCGTVETPEGMQLPVPCKYDGPPKKVTDIDLLKRFDEICPTLNVLENIEQGLCCSQVQIQQFLSQMQRARDILGNCPACLINFSQLFCDMTCSPDQAKFVQVTHSTPYDNPNATATATTTTNNTNNSITTDTSNKSTDFMTRTKLEQVDEILYTINLDFVNDLFNSCKNVIWTLIHEPAINILCGEGCTPKKWVEHLGLKGLSPFDIKYSYSGEPRVKAVACNKSVGDYYPRDYPYFKSPCSTVDCPSDIQPEPETQADIQEKERDMELHNQVES